MAKYVVCDYCGKKILFGEDVYTDSDAQGVYCSEHCYCENNAYMENVDEIVAAQNNWYVYDDDARIAEIRREMEDHRMAMEKLFTELQALTTQN